MWYKDEHDIRTYNIGPSVKICWVAGKRWLVYRDMSQEISGHFLSSEIPVGGLYYAVFNHFDFSLWNLISVTSSNAPRNHSLGHRLGNCLPQLTSESLLKKLLAYQNLFSAVKFITETSCGLNSCLHSKPLSRVF